MKENGCLTKNDIVSAVYLKSDLKRRDVVDYVEYCFDKIKSGLKEDGKVVVSGFGTFVVNSKKARKGRNPQTASVIELRARKVVKFRASERIKALVQGQEEKE